MDTADYADTADHADPTAARRALPLAAALFPSVARDRAWDQPTALDLLDLANAAVRRLEAVAHLIDEGARPECWI